MGAVQLPGHVAQRAERKHPILLHGTCGVDQHDVDLRLYITVLETVVHDDQIHLGMLGADAADTVRSPFAHHDAHIGKFAFDLQRFVAHVAVMIRRRNLAVTLRATAVTARQQCHAMRLRHVVDDHFGQRSLARTADGDVADADDRNVELLAMQNPPIEQLMTEQNRHLVKP